MTRRRGRSAIDARVRDSDLERIYRRDEGSARRRSDDGAAGADGRRPPDPTTAVRAETLVALNERLLDVAAGVQAASASWRSTLERRRDAMGDAGGDRLGSRRGAGVRRRCCSRASASASPARTPSAARSRTVRRCCTTWRPARRTRRSQHLPQAQRHVRDLQQPAVGDGGAGLRVRLQHRGAGRRWCCGKRSTATSSTSRSRSSISSSRPTARSGGRIRARAAAAARLRRAGSRALERAPRAVPAALRRGQHVRRVSVDAGAVLPHPAPPGAARDRDVRWC